MSDIFISYKSEDRAKAKTLARALERRNFSVWWDPEIPPAKEYRQVIAKALDEAKCVIVLWSKASVGSKFVREEANRGDRRGILISVLIDDVEMPLGFGEDQAVHLVDWKGSPSHTEFNRLLNAVSEILHRPPPPPPPTPWLKIALGLVTIVSVTLSLTYLLWPTHLMFAPKQGENPAIKSVTIDGDEVHEVSFRFRPSRSWCRGGIVIGILVDNKYPDARILDLNMKVGQRIWRVAPDKIMQKGREAVLVYRPRYTNDLDHVLTVTASKLPILMKIESNYLKQYIEWETDNNTE